MGSETNKSSVDGWDPRPRFFMDQPTNKWTPAEWKGVDDPTPHAPAHIAANIDDVRRPPNMLKSHGIPRVHQVLSPRRNRVGFPRQISTDPTRRAWALVCPTKSRHPPDLGFCEDTEDAEDTPDEGFPPDPDNMPYGRLRYTLAAARLAVHAGRERPRT